MRTKGLNVEAYLIIFIDYYSRMTWVPFLIRKLKAFELFKIFKKEVENETDMNIKYLRLDHGGEFTSKKFEIFCEDHGIRRQYSCTRTPQHNGVVEIKK